MQKYIKFVKGESVLLQLRAVFFKFSLAAEAYNR